MLSLKKQRGGTTAAGTTAAGITAAATAGSHLAPPPAPAPSVPAGSMPSTVWSPAGGSSIAPSTQGSQGTLQGQLQGQLGAAAPAATSSAPTTQHTSALGGAAGTNASGLQRVRRAGGPAAGTCVQRPAASLACTCAPPRAPCPPLSCPLPALQLCILRYRLPSEPALLVDLVDDEDVR